MRVPVVSRTIAEQRAHLMREIVETLLFVGLVFVIIHFAIQTNQVSDNNMEPQLRPNQLIVVNKAAYLVGGPQRGDVVVFYDPTDLNREVIERVIAVPGDTITISASQVTVNGVALNEPYVHVRFGSAESPVIVPKLKLGRDEYYVLNDSRLMKGDSRTFGPLHRGNIVGKAVVAFWPLSEFTLISNYSDVFSGIH